MYERVIDFETFRSTILCLYFGNASFVWYALFLILFNQIQASYILLYPIQHSQ